MSINLVVSIVTVFVLAAAHPISAFLARKHVKTRTISFCAGTALAYVFLHLLPELSSLQQELLESKTEDNISLWFEEHVYVIALAGLLLFQVVDWIGRTSDTTKAKMFSYRAEMFFFSLYALLVGYLLIANAELDRPVLLVTVALVAHLFGTDIDLTERYEELFVKKGSIFLSVATVTGMVIALFFRVNDLVYMAGFSFMAGGILINTFRTELPDPHKVKNIFLISGALFYSILMLMINFIIRI